MEIQLRSNVIIATQVNYLDDINGPKSNPIRNSVEWWNSIQKAFDEQPQQDETLQNLKETYDEELVIKAQVQIVHFFCTLLC